MSNSKHRCLIVSCHTEEGVIVALEQAAILVSTSGYLGLEFVIFGSEIRHWVITGRSQVPTDHLVSVALCSVMAFRCCSPYLSFHNCPPMTWKGEEVSSRTLQPIIKYWDCGSDWAVPVCPCKGFYSLLRHLTKIGPFLSADSEKVISPFISSRLLEQILLQ